MRIYCYYEPLADRDFLLLKLWRQHWDDMGYETVVLTERDAKLHMKYGALCDKVSTLPTVNHPGFERACYVRWLAYALEGGIFADYDVFAHGNLHVSMPDRGLTNFSRFRAPGFIAGKVGSAERIVNAILAYQPDEKDRCYDQPHVSDMVICQRVEGLFDRVFDWTWLYGLEGWQRWPLVHFGNGYIPKDRTRYDTIKEVLNEWREQQCARPTHARGLV